MGSASQWRKYLGYICTTLLWIFKLFYRSRVDLWIPWTPESVMTSIEKHVVDFLTYSCAKKDPLNSESGIVIVIDCVGGKLGIQLSHLLIRKKYIINHKGIYGFYFILILFMRTCTQSHWSFFGLIHTNQIKE